MFDQVELCILAQFDVVAIVNGQILSGVYRNENGMQGSACN